MRLIDADKLKFKDVAEVNGKLTHVLLPEDIADAPTVEPDEVYMTGEDYNLYMEGYKSGLSDGRKDAERPKGEWNYIQAGMAVCPFCGASPHQDYKNFCPKCGAEMMTKEGDTE